MEDFLIFLQNSNIAVKMLSHFMDFYCKKHLSISDYNRIIC